MVAISDFATDAKESGNLKASAKAPLRALRHFILSQGFDISVFSTPLLTRRAAGGDTWGGASARKGACRRNRHTSLGC